ncbi:septation protein SepH [Kribbella sp. NPDC056861]|uniref:septation protein SepH n=1 Tax=Kribbella sp. NPDC056861 TaxID=3154857 RepID=UPI0034357C39
MREARLVGLSQDGKQLILAMAETGEEFAVPVDDRLRAALRGDRARLGQLEIQMESALRPRDIQARIRAGESPEAVAAVAQMPMERVMAFAGPVLAERDHVASLAQRASVRRRGGGDAPTRNLGAWVSERLRIRGVDPASAEWDAWRRDDGRWAVRVSYFAEQNDEKVAMFAYDAPGRYAVPDDDEARWLVGEQVQVIAPQPTSERRLTAVADFDLSLAPDHGADSYEAGFEDTISLPRGRAAQADRDANRDTGRGYGRDPEYGTARDVERGARRVHSVPSPDEEPTLINVPIEPPPSVRQSVRAVERSAQLPVEAPPLSPPEERAAAPENRFTERRMSPPDSRRVEPRQPEPYQPEPRRSEPAADERRPESGAPWQTRRPTREEEARAELARRERVREEQAREDEARQEQVRRDEAEQEKAAQARARQEELQRESEREEFLRQESARQESARQESARQESARQESARQESAAQEQAKQEVPRPADPRPSVPKPSDPRQFAPKPSDPRRQQAPAADPVPVAEPAAEAAPAPAPEEKKKPAKRASKRASVPSWDEIMFGKKAD